MTLDDMIWATQTLVALALLQHSAEHLAARNGLRALFAVRIALCLALVLGVAPIWPLGGLFVISLVLLHHFQGPYNGGSDKMGVLILSCLLVAHWVPKGFWQEVIMGYLAVQVTLSYFISGRVKLVNSEWRSGQALSDVFAFSAYPVSEALRGLSRHRGLMKTASWAVILLEVAFPLALLNGEVLVMALVAMGGFHLANACLFGLNRFLWIWLAAYPSLIWLQDRVMGG